MAERVGFEPTVPVRVRRFSRPFRYDHFGISPFVATIFYHIILRMSIVFLKTFFPCGAVFGNLKKSVDITP